MASRKLLGDRGAPEVCASAGEVSQMWDQGGGDTVVEGQEHIERAVDDSAGDVCEDTFVGGDGAALRGELEHGESGGELGG